MTITSFTNKEVTYETTEHNCTCGDWQFRGSRTGKDCKHMVALKKAIAQEVERAARFLAIKAEIEQAEREARERAEIERRENQGCYERMMNSPW